MEDILRMQAEINDTLLRYEEHLVTKSKRKPEYPATFSDSDSFTQGKCPVQDKSWNTTFPVLPKRRVKQRRYQEPSMVEACKKGGGIPAKDMLLKPAGISLQKPNEIPMEAVSQLPRVPTHTVSNNNIHSIRDQIKQMQYQIEQMQEEVDNKIKQLNVLKMSCKDARAIEINSDSHTTEAQHPLAQFRANSGLSASQVRPSRYVDSDSTDSEDNPRPLVGHKRSANISKTGIPALRNLPKTLVFNGKANWLAFKLKFSRYAEVNEWTHDECRDCLLHCLTDQALTYGAMLLRRDSTLPYRKMMHKLDKRFGA
jgi:hypothetical protein